MKKVFNIWNWAILLTLCIGISSCSKEDDEIRGLIVGKWQLVEIIVNEDYNHNWPPCTFEMWWEFKNNGNFTQYDPCDIETPVINTIWTLDGNTLTPYLDEDRPYKWALTVLLVNKSELIVKFQEDGLTTERFVRIQ